jgi:hypothetical protein
MRSSAGQLHFPKGNVQSRAHSLFDELAQEETSDTDLLGYERGDGVIRGRVMDRDEG